MICWDLEIEKPVSDTTGGWDGAKRGDCGISALVLSDSDTGRYHIYDKHTLEEAVDHLNGADLLVGFNTIEFDSSVVFGVTGRYITVEQYDICQEVWRTLKKRQKGYKLDEIAQATLGVGKNSNGEFATTLVRKKRWGQLFDYCLNDVHLVRELYNHINELGWIRGTPGIDLFLERPLLKDYA